MPNSVSKALHVVALPFFRKFLWLCASRQPTGLPYWCVAPRSIAGNQPTFPSLATLVQPSHTHAKYTLKSGMQMIIILLLPQMPLPLLLCLRLAKMLPKAPTTWKVHQREVQQERFKAADPQPTAYVSPVKKSSLPFSSGCTAKKQANESCPSYYERVCLMVL